MRISLLGEPQEDGEVWWCGFPCLWLFCWMMIVCWIIPPFAPILFLWSWAQSQYILAPQARLLPLTLWVAVPQPSKVISLLEQHSVPHCISASISVPSSSSLPQLLLSICPPSYVWMCASLRHVYVLSREFFVNYSCLTCCIFKGRDIEVLSCHIGADVSQKFFQESIFLCGL